jgi:hypothetical protein
VTAINNELEKTISDKIEMTFNPSDVEKAKQTKDTMQDISLDTSKQGGKIGSGQRTKRIRVELHLLLAPSCFKSMKISTTHKEIKRQTNK